MPPYEAYVWADIGPIIAGSGLIYIAYFLYLVYVCCKSGERVESKAERRMVKFVLGDLCTEENNGSLYIHGRRVVPAVVRALVGYVFNITLLAFAVGWDIFLVETSYACDPGLDCFIRETSQSIQNCSAFYDNRNDTIGNNTGNGNDTEDSELTVVCFRFGFNYVLAASATGGLFVFSKQIMSVIAFANILICDRFVNAKVVAALAFQMICLLPWIPIFIVTAEVGEIRTIAFKNISSITQFYTLIITIMFATLIPWYLLPEKRDGYAQLEGSVNQSVEKRPVGPS